MSGDLKWLEIMLQPDDVETKIAKLCAVKGAYHLYDDALSEAYFQACEYNDWNPRRGASLTTYLVGIAKYWLMDQFRAEKREFPVDFVDELTDEPGQMLMPVVKFDDPFNNEVMPSWYRVLWFDLSDVERQCLGYLLLCASSKRVATYRELGKALGCSHVSAGKILASVRDKAERAIKWTRALSALSQLWAEAGTFR